MNDIDQRIQAALRRDASAPDLGQDPNIAEEVVATFRGRNRILSLFVAAYSVVLFAGAIWAGYRFYHAATVTAQIQWAALAFALLLTVMMVKIWFWFEMHSNRILREVKRVELLLATRRSGS